MKWGPGMCKRKPDHEDTIEVHAEDVDISKRLVERGRVRIESSVEDVPFSRDVEYGQDVVDVKHVPIDEEFDEIPQTRQEGNTIIIPVVEEVVVISKRYRLVEEVHVTRRRETQTEHVETTVKRQSVSVEIEGDVAEETR